jgi:hypothetical protein
MVPAIVLLLAIPSLSVLCLAAPMNAGLHAAFFEKRFQRPCFVALDLADYSDYIKYPSYANCY